MACLVALIGMTAALTLMPRSARAESCDAPHVQDAVAMRHLQTELMVAALLCDMQDRYNDFVTRFQAPMAARGTVLRAHFGRALGGGRGADRALTNYVTAIANQASHRAQIAGGHFCQTVPAMFDAILMMDGERLAEAALMRARERPVLRMDHCAPPVTQMVSAPAGQTTVADVQVAPGAPTGALPPMRPDAAHLQAPPPGGAANAQP